MHELRFVNEIVAVLKQKLGKGAVSRQVVVNVRLSPFSHVSAESLQETFKELVKGESFSDVCLKILPLDILLECNSCKRSSRITQRVFGCPLCNSMDVDLKMEKEFFVESLEIEH